MSTCSIFSRYFLKVFLCSVVVLSSGEGSAVHAQKSVEPSAESHGYSARILFGGMFPVTEVPVPEQFEAGVQEATFGEGIGLGIQLERRLSEKWGIQLNVLTAYNSTFTARSSNGTAVVTETDHAAVSLEALYVPAPNLSVQPFALVGAGVKTHELDVLTGAFPNFDPSVSVGGGVSAPVTESFGVNFSVRDHVTWFNPNPAFGTSVQHDLWVMTGATLSF